ncbi:hypothetical protein CUMW_278970 [Citrus unshiu]|uniref:Uncharacterized protein n=1 Tax=Citrus unshiu TaxID=55188 RepID=A0A2H5N6R9_CITUN|nr:hypothetical protein CUMW_278970 [Citrus unshiu]
MKLEQNIRCTCTGEKLDSLVEKSSDLKVQLRRYRKTGILYCLAFIWANNAFIAYRMCIDSNVILLPSICSTKTGKETNQCCTITVEHFEAKQSYFVEAGWITEMGKTKSMRQW